MDEPEPTTRIATYLTSLKIIKHKRLTYAMNTLSLVAFHTTVIQYMCHINLSYPNSNEHIRIQNKEKNNRGKYKDE